MAKKIVGTLKLRIQAGSASPAPPVGPALGQRGVNIMEFCKAFNAKTQELKGDVLPVVLTVYADKSFTFIVKKPSAADLIKKELKLSKGSSMPNKEKVGEVDMATLKKLAEVKMSDLNTDDVDAATNMFVGAARSIGLLIKD